MTALRMRKWTEILKRESPIVLARELAWRTRKNWDKKRILARIDQKSCPVTFRSVAYYSPDLSSLAKSSRTTITAFANEICEGRFPFLGYGSVNLGRQPKWNFDFVSGHEWPHVPLENRNCMRFDGSDVKVPYELSRLQFLPVLGKAHRLTGDDRYRETAKGLLSQWLQDNPVGVGVNWSLAMEAALRGMSICFLLDLLFPFRSQEKRWVLNVTRSLWEHMNYIEAHIEFSHLTRSNHYLSNILGLLCLSVFLDGPGMAAKRERFRRRIEKEILHQVYEDGGDFEASTGYQVLVAQMFTSALLLIRASEGKVGKSLLQRIEAMYHLMSAVASASSELPHVGDCDDGRVELLLDDLEQMLSLPVPQRNSLRVSNLLGIGASLFGGARGTAEDAKWYGIQAGKLAAGHVPGTNSHHSTRLTVFPQSGIGVIRAGLAELLFFAIPNGIAGKGSHTHNDKLSFVLRLDGREVLCDSGTAGYTRDPALRNHFRTTRAHNTVMVNNLEQNTIYSGDTTLFRIGNEAEVSCIEHGTENGVHFLRASHNGYLGIDITHTRTIRLPDSGKTGIIEDHLDGSGQHDVEVNFQLAPGCTVAKIEGGDTKVHCELNGPRGLSLVFKAPGDVCVDSRETLVSMTYGGVTPAIRLCLSGRVTLPVCLVTELYW
jgi:hypothetical protein